MLQENSKVDACEFPEEAVQPDYSIGMDSLLGILHGRESFVTTLLDD